MAAFPSVTPSRRVSSRAAEMGFRDQFISSRTQETTSITSCCHGEFVNTGPVAKRSFPKCYTGRYQPIIGFGLGTWQVKRLRWKEALIEELGDKLARDPMRLPKRIK
jgi:hypothetical protein